MSAHFASSAIVGNAVKAPVGGVELASWTTRPGSLLELLQSPEAPRVPIQPFELGLLRQLLHEQTDCWDLLRHYSLGRGGEELVVQRHRDTELFEGALFGRYRCVLPGASLETCLYSICNFDDRLIWDKQGHSYEVRQTGDLHGCETCYFAVHLPALAGRDFLSYHTIQATPDGRGVLVYMRQAADELRPPSQRVVRGSIYCNAFEIVSRDQGGVELTFISCLDTKLALSSWLVNFFVPGQMRTWFGGLAARAAAHGAVPPRRVSLPAAPGPETSAARDGIPRLDDREEAHEEADTTPSRVSETEACPVLSPSSSPTGLGDAQVQGAKAGSESPLELTHLHLISGATRSAARGAGSGPGLGAVGSEKEAAEGEEESTEEGFKPDTPGRSSQCSTVVPMGASDTDFTAIDSATSIQMESTSCACACSWQQFFRMGY